MPKREQECNGADWRARLIKNRALTPANEVPTPPVLGGRSDHPTLAIDDAGKRAAIKHQRRPVDLRSAWEKRRNP